MVVEKLHVSGGVMGIHLYALYRINNKSH